MAEMNDALRRMEEQELREYAARQAAKKAALKAKANGIAKEARSARIAARQENGRQGRMTGTPPEPLPALDLLDAADFAGKPVPKREFLDSASLLPMRNVSLLSGDGGIGKSLLALQLAVAVTAGIEWIGLVVKSGPVVYLSAEDDEDELQIRLADICAAEDRLMANLAGLKLAPLAGRDAVLAAEDRKTGRLVETPLMARLRGTLAAVKPVLLVIDNLADVFAGNEIVRAFAKHFVGMLRGLAIDFNCAVLLLGHPSLSGLNSGSGMSGSTAWHNSVRSRLYLTATRDRQDETQEAEVDSDQRWLRAMKANYAPLAEPVSLRWQHGRFVRTDARSPFDGVTVAHLEAVRRAFDEQEWKYDVQSPAWGGHCVADLLHIDIGKGVKQHDRSKAQKLALHRVQGILSAWMRNGQIGIVTRKDNRQGRTVKFFCSRGA